MPKINKKQLEYNNQYDELYNIYMLLEKCKFIANINRTAKLGLTNGDKKGKGYTNPVGLKLNYCNGNYELPRFDEVNGGLIYDTIEKFICRHYPDHKFNALTINKNFRCKKHVDNKNVGDSLVVGLGDYTGGELNLYTNEWEKKRKYSWLADDMKTDIKFKPLIFNGSEIPHSVDEWIGTRYSIVAYYL